MKIENPIGWCDATGNMVIGCTKVSPGCAHCYAANDTPARVLRAKGVETWGLAGTRHPVKALAEKARRLNKLCICDKCHEAHSGSLVGYQCTFGSCGGTLRRIHLFADSNSDWLDDRWPVEKRVELLTLIHECQNIDWQLLTKRPENWYNCIWEALLHAEGITDPDLTEQDPETPVGMMLNDWVAAWTGGGSTPTNVWIGVSVEDQKRANERIPELLKIPAKVRFLSCEPLLEEVSFDGQRIEWLSPFHELDAMLSRTAKIDWVIVGGESDQPKAPARPCNVDWIRRIVRQCQAAKVPVYVKQLGDHCLDRNDAGFEGDKDDGWPMDTATEETAVSGCQGDPVRILFKTKAGADPAEWPADLRVREFPKGTTT